MHIEPFKAAHAQNLFLQPTQEYLKAWCDEHTNMQLYEAHRSFSLIGDDGNTLACAGLVKLWPGRANAWAMLSANIGGAGMLAATRAIRREFQLSQFRRIEAYVDCEFEAAQRWIKLLGFENETPNGMREWINGRSSDMYVRIQNV